MEGSRSALCSSDELDLILRTVSSLLLRTDAEGKVFVWNGETAGVLEVPPDTAPGLPLEEFCPRLDVGQLRAGFERCMASRTMVRIDELPFETSSQARHYLGLTLNPMLASDGTVTGCLILGRDITDHKRVELQLVQAQKLEAIGQLAAGVAHEINTPMQYISDNIRFLREMFTKVHGLLEACAGWSQSLSSGQGVPGAATTMLSTFRDIDFAFLAEEAPQAVEDALKGIDRVSEIIRAMKSLSYTGSGEKEPVDLNQALRDTVTVAAHEWRNVAAVEMDLDTELPQVACLAGEINQVLLNMLVNAVHAIQAADRAGSGKIRIATRQEGDCVAITIRDTGCGISEEVRGQIFDPFFTTKEVGRGTGQGLAISHAVICRKHGGSIAVKSEPGQGTEFTVRLPIEEAGESRKCA